MPSSALSTAGGVVGYEASQGDQAQAQADMQAALAAYQNIQVPTIAEQQWNLAQEQAAGSLQPQTEATYSMGPNAMNNIQTNPQFATAQQAALTQLGQLGQGGLTAQERANLINSNQAIAGQTNAQNSAIQQQMAARGMGGSGVQLAAQLSNSQNAANQAYNNSNAINAQAQNQALAATAQMGGLATQEQGQQFGQQAAIAQAQNAINQFNTANQQNVAGVNTQTQNQAQAANLANLQNIGNTNVGLQNQQQAHNTGLYQQQFSDQMAQAAGESGMDVANAGYMGNQASQLAGMWSGVGSGLGTVATGLSGSSNPFSSSGSSSSPSSSSMNNSNETMWGPGQWTGGEIEGYADGGMVDHLMPLAMLVMNKGGEVSTLGMNSFAEGGYVGGSDANSVRGYNHYAGGGAAGGGTGGAAGGAGGNSGGMGGHGGGAPVGGGIPPKHKYGYADGGNVKSPQQQQLDDLEKSEQAAYAPKPSPSPSPAMSQGGMCYDQGGQIPPQPNNDYWQQVMSQQMAPTSNPQVLQQAAAANPPTPYSPQYNAQQQAAIQALIASRMQGATQGYDDGGQVSASPPSPQVSDSLAPYMPTAAEEANSGLPPGPERAAYMAHQKKKLADMQSGKGGDTPGYAQGGQADDDNDSADSNELSFQNKASQLALQKQLAGIQAQQSQKAQMMQPQAQNPATIFPAGKASAIAPLAMPNPATPLTNSQSQGMHNPSQYNPLIFQGQGYAKGGNVKHPPMPHMHKGQMPAPAPMVPNPAMGSVPATLTPQQKMAIMAKLQGTSPMSMQMPGSVPPMAPPGAPAPASNIPSPAMADGGQIQRDSHNQRSATYSQNNSSPMNSMQRAKTDALMDAMMSSKHIYSNGGEAQYDFRSGGHVPGKEVVPGDSPKNDTVNAKLSPGEIVVKKTVAQSGDPEKILGFVKDVLAKKKGKQSA